MLRVSREWYPSDIKDGLEVRFVNNFDSPILIKGVGPNLFQQYIKHPNGTLDLIVETKYSAERLSTLFTGFKVITEQDFQICKVAFAEGDWGV